MRSRVRLVARCASPLSHSAVEHLSRSLKHVVRTLPPTVATLLASYPLPLRQRLLAIRELILDVAATTPGVGEIDEALRWGQLAYLTTETKSGSLIRIDRYRADDARYALIFHCQTTLVDTFREVYREQLAFDGNRCIVLSVDVQPPLDMLRDCIRRALTYHRKAIF